MAQLIVRKLDDSVKEQLQRRAARHRRSVEAEVRDILSAAVAPPESSHRDLGSRIARRFAAVAIDLEVKELHGHAAALER